MDNFFGVEWVRAIVPLQSQLSIRDKNILITTLEAEDSLYQSANFLLLPEAFVFVAC